MMNDDAQPLTMRVAEYVETSGLSQYAVRQEIAAGRIPHVRVGRRGLIRILRLPALAVLTKAPASTATSQDKAKE